MAASKPTSSLSMDMDNLHPLTLKQYFGTLTIVWVVPLSDVELTPDTPSPEVYNAMSFGVGQGTERFLPLNPQSVSLQSALPRSRHDYGQFR